MRSWILVAIAVVVLGLGALLLMPRAGDQGAPTPDEPTSDTASHGPLRQDDPGYALYQRMGCRVCHGRDLGGTEKAPALLDLAGNWTVEELMAYIESPESMIPKKPELQILKERYAQSMMPGYPIESSDLEQLATFLLHPTQ